MFQRDYIGLTVVSDVVANLSAAWFGAAIVTVSILEVGTLRGILTFTANIGFGTLALLAAIKLRRLSKLLSYAKPN
jgi:hypothetical protein